MILGTVAVRDPALVREAARLFPGRVAVGIDARGGKVAVEGWEQPTARQIRESFAIPDPVLGLEDTRKAWRDVAPIWIKQASDLGIKLD